MKKTDNVSVPALLLTIAIVALGVIVRAWLAQGLWPDVMPALGLSTPTPPLGVFGALGTISILVRPYPDINQPKRDFESDGNMIGHALGVGILWPGAAYGVARIFLHFFG